MLKSRILVIILIIFGSTAWSLTMFKSGQIYDFGMGFWGANAHDGIWHISLANSILSSKEMPTYAGYEIKNYHLGFTYLLAFVAYVSNVDTVDIYFRIIPPIVSVLTGVVTYLLVRELSNRNSAIFSIITLYFSTSMGPLIGKGDSAFWSQQSMSTLINPPYAFSLLFSLFGIYLYKRNIKIISAIIFAFAVHFKIYSILFLPFLFLVTGNNYIFGKENLLNYLKTIITFALVYLGVLTLIDVKIDNLLVFHPLWFVETMMSISDRLGWQKWYGAMVAYSNTNQYLKLALVYLLSTGIFIAGNMGIRFLGLLIFKTKLNKRPEIRYLLFTTIAFILPTLIFVQKGTPWNTIQFFYYAQITMGIMLSILLGEVKLNSWFKKSLVAIFFIIFGIAPSIYELRHYLPQTPPAMISKQELEALNTLKKLPKGIVLSYPAIINPYGIAPRNIYEYESTAYISAFSRQKVFMENEVNLQILGFQYKDRKEEIVKFFQTSSIEYAKEFLRKNNIRYIYLHDVDSIRPKIGQSDLGLKNIFENSDVAIYEVK